MTCPSCGGELVIGAERCPVCDATVAPRVEGALAAEPRLVTPPARGTPRDEPIREIPALRRQPRERSWRDEVQDRVRSRRQKRAEAGLPLFDGLDGAEAPQPSAPAPTPTKATPAAAAPPAEPGPASASPPPAPAPPAPRELGDTWPPFPEKKWELEPAAKARPDARPGTAERRDDPLADLPLGAGDADGTLASPAPDGELYTLDQAIASRRRGMPSLETDELGHRDVAEPEVELPPPAVELSPVERPARPFERVQAAAVDLALFSLLAIVVVYFAGRAARVGLDALVASWPWLAAYLGLLGVFYASYFTGTTGQTPGKLITGLRVVGASGRPPAYPRAAARAVAGLVSVVAAGLGCLPMAFDPAARALHDRLFRTRVVRG
jgi:uncharacterized RDD family membrane protein YckC